MSYQEQLSPWVIHQLMPNLQRRAIARFRNRNDAEAYLKIIGQMMPQSQFTVAFEMKTPAPVSTAAVADAKVAKSKGTKAKVAKVKATKTKTATVH